MDTSHIYHVEFVVCKRDGTWLKIKYPVPEAVFTGSDGDAFDYCSLKLQKYDADPDLIFIDNHYMDNKRTIGGSAEFSQLNKYLRNMSRLK